MSIAEIELESVLDLYNIGALHEQFTKALDSDEVVLVAGEVARMKSPAAQLIVAFGAELKCRDKALKLREPSEAFGRVFGLLGCGHLLKEWGE